MKRALIVLSIISLLFSGLFAEGKQEAADSYTLRLSHVLPTDHQNHKTALKFAELVSEKTGGKVTIEVFPAAQLGNEKEIIDAVAMGTLDFALCGFGEVTKRYPVSGIFDAPFVFRNREHLAQVYKTDVFWNIMEDMKKVNIEMIAPGYYGTRHVTTTDTPAKTPADLNGLKLRCPDQPMFVATTKAMGATPTPMAFSEVYLALQQGVADGQENPAAAITSMKFYEVQKYLVKTGHIIYGNHIFGSTRTLDKLPADLRAAVEEAGKEVSEYWINASFSDEDALLNGLVEKGMTIIEPDLDAFVKNAQFIYDDNEATWGEGLLETLRAVK